MMCLSFLFSDTLAGANLSATRQSTRVSKGDASPIWARNGSLANFLELCACELRRIPIPGTGVKIALGRLHFHGFGVARQGPWITWVNTAASRPLLRKPESFHLSRHSL